MDETYAEIVRAVGKYGDTEVLLEGDVLIYKRRYFCYRFMPLTEIARLIGRYPDGREIVHLLKRNR